MITKDEITTYICSYALFLNEMLMFRYTVAHMNANIHLVMNSFGTLFHDKIFSLTFFKFPDISRFSREVVTLRSKLTVIVQEKCTFLYQLCKLLS